MIEQTTLPTPADYEDLYVTYGAASIKRRNGGGQYVVQLEARDQVPCKMKGGQGGYLPRSVMLVWATEDGITWSFSHAIITGAQVNEAGGRRGYDTTQHIHLNDETYRASEPVWLAQLVEDNAPGRK